MDYKSVYETWLKDEDLDNEIKAELLSIKDDDKEIEDRFYKELEFGTAGLRGKLGAGTNRMNKYVVAKTTQGFAEVIKDKGNEAMDRGVVIAHDNRKYSDVFAQVAAEVLCANGIKAYLFDSLRPTPELSYGVRELNAIGGINITASHNPKEYNGYKVYWEDGAQILSDIADEIVNKIGLIKDSKDIHSMDKESAVSKGILSIVGQELDDKYMAEVESLALDNDIDKNISIVYTALNGAGNVPVRRILDSRGFTNIHIVAEQADPDPSFTTVKHPNPEDVGAFDYAMRLGQKVDAELLIATDPDCDRLGIMIKDNQGDYIKINGNQLGALLINYILYKRKEQGTLPDNGVIIKSVVTGSLGQTIAKSYGVETIDTLTGFKYICGKVKEFICTKEYEFLFGYEESLGYVYGTFVRDKDAVIAAMLVAEMSAYYKKKGKKLYTVLQEIYSTYGYYSEKQISIVLEGIEGKKKIDKMMTRYKREYIKSINNAELVEYTDFNSNTAHDLIKGISYPVDIPRTNLLRYVHSDGCWYAIRPSGTEPKIKLYIYTTGDTMEIAETRLRNIEKEVLERLEIISNN